MGGCWQLAATPYDAWRTLRNLAAYAVNEGHQALINSLLSLVATLHHQLFRSIDWPVLYPGPGQGKGEAGERCGCMACWLNSRGGSYFLPSPELLRHRRQQGRADRQLDAARLLLQVSSMPSPGPLSGVL